MKKWVIILGVLFISYPAMSEISGICGATAEACSYVFDDNGKLTITGNGAMSEHSGYNPPWGTDIKEVSISGITSIASHAFVGSKITSIVIPDTVTSIGSYPFEGSTITSITLPASLKNLSAGVFATNRTIENVFIPDSLFENGSYFSDLALSGGHVKNLICSAEKQQACQEYLSNAKGYKSGPWPQPTEPLPNRDKIGVLTYRKDENGHIIFKNKKYASFSDIASGRYIPKRIYTVEEANAATGKKNKVMIKYK